MTVENGAGALDTLIEDQDALDAEQFNIPPVPSTPDVGGLAGARVSLIEELRARREKLLHARPRLTLAAPNFGTWCEVGEDELITKENGRLLIRYRQPEWLEVKHIGERWGKSKHPKSELYAHADTLAACCDGIVAVDDDGNQVPLADGPVVRFMEAARALGDDPRTDREAVFLILTEVQTSIQYWQFDAWTSTASQEVDADLSGESSAATPA